MFTILDSGHAVDGIVYSGENLTCYECSDRFKVQYIYDTPCQRRLSEVDVRPCGASDTYCMVRQQKVVQALWIVFWRIAQYTPDNTTNTVSTREQRKIQKKLCWVIYHAFDTDSQWHLVLCVDIVTSNDTFQTGAM